MQLANRTKNFCFVSISLGVCNINCSEKEKKNKTKNKFYLQFSDISWNCFGQDLQALVATSNHCIQAGTFRRTAREWGTTIVIIS